MERRKRYLSARHLPVLVLAALAVAIMSFSFPYFSHAAGEPTVAITLGDTALTSGETATVTFFFSASPSGFDNTDVDLSDANGTISTVAVTSDDRVYTATFTPNVGVNDPTNTIIVGTAWVDSGGNNPLAPASSANFSVQTVSTGGGGSCPAPSVKLGSPNGGETLVSGSDVDVFWSMTGCQATSLSLLLSSDGGASYAVVATSPQPTYGYYRWTVPDRPSSSSRLQVKLRGSGGTELASDESDGTFAILSTSSPPAGGTTSPPATSTPPTASPPPEPPAPEPPPPAPAPAPSSEPAGPPAPTPAPAPAAAPTTTTPARPMAPPMPNIPIPLAPTTVAPDTSTPPTDAPMDTENQDNPAMDAAPATLSLDSVQGAVETASGFVPAPLDLVFSFVLGALTTLGLVLGTQQAIKRRKAKSKNSCRHCLGTGEEPPEKKAMEKCDACDGTGQVEDENEPAMECKHCQGEGEDPCHRCKGLGKDAAGQECPACKGGGKTLTGKQGKDGEDEIADCEICHGEGEVSAAIKKMIPCEKCTGTGKI